MVHENQTFLIKNFWELKYQMSNPPTFKNKKMHIFTRFIFSCFSFDLVNNQRSLNNDIDFAICLLARQKIEKLHIWSTSVNVFNITHTYLQWSTHVCIIFIQRFLSIITCSSPLCHCFVLNCTQYIWTMFYVNIKPVDSNFGFSLMIFCPTFFLHCWIYRCLQNLAEARQRLGIGVGKERQTLKQDLFSKDM